MVLHDPYKPITLGSLGGEDNLVQIEIDSLIRLGHEVIDARKFDQGLERKVNQIKAQSFGFHSDVITMIDRYKPEVIHTHNLSQRSGYSWMNFVDIPIVSSLHNYRIFCPSSIAWRSGSVCFECRDKSAFSAIKHKCASYVGLVNASRFLLFQRDNPQIHKPIKFIFPSNLMADSMKSLIPKSKTEILRSPSVKSFFKKPLKRQGWIFAGRLSAEKGIISLIQSWPSHEKLDIAGDGPLMNQIIELIKNLDNINLIGVYPPGENSIFEKYEGMIFASSWMEGSPLVVADCLGSGTPVICTDQSGAREQIEISHGGFVVKGQFTESKLLEAMFDVRANFENYSKNAFECAASTFSIDVWSKKLEKIISNVLG